MTSESAQDNSRMKAVITRPTIAEEVVKVAIDTFKKNDASLYVGEYNNMKNNEDRCESVAEIARKLKSITQMEGNDNLKSTLRNIDSVVQSADKLIKKFNNADSDDLFLRSSKYQDDFDNMNQKLFTASVQLNEALYEELKQMSPLDKEQSRSWSRCRSCCVIL